MDTSEQYKTMWEKARKIQNNPLETKLPVTGLPLYDDPMDLLFDDSKIVWHPIENKDKANGERLLKKFYDFVDWSPTISAGYCTPHSEIFTSLEQIMLAFTMKHVYEKHWNGSEWI